MMGFLTTEAVAGVAKWLLPMGWGHSSVGKAIASQA